MRKVAYLLLSLFLLLSCSAFAQRSIDELIIKYKDSPKAGMEMFILSDETKNEMVEVLTKYGSLFPSAFSPNDYKKIVDHKVISCIGTNAQEFYDEVIAFFDKQEGYTTSRSRFGSMRSKGYTLITKDKVMGKTIRETNSIMLKYPEEGESESNYNAAVMTIITEEEE